MNVFQREVASLSVEFVEKVNCLFIPHAYLNK